MAGFRIDFSYQNSRNILQALQSKWQPRLPLDELYAFYALSHSKRMPIEEEIYLKARKLERVWGRQLIDKENVAEGGALRVCTLTSDGSRLSHHIRYILSRALKAEQTLLDD